MLFCWETRCNFCRKSANRSDPLATAKWKPAASSIKKELCIPKNVGAFLETRCGPRWWKSEVVLSPTQENATGNGAAARHLQGQEGWSLPAYQPADPLPTREVWNAHKSVRGVRATLNVCQAGSQSTNSDWLIMPGPSPGPLTWAHTEKAKNG